jgi:hypothetical protein
MWCCLLLVLVLNLEEDQSAVVLVVHQTLEVVSWLCAVRKEMKSTTIQEKSEIDIQESFFLLFTSISSSRIENKSSTSKTSLSEKDNLSS